MDFLGIGLGEILVILVIALLIFGPGKIVEISRSLGRTVNNVRKTASEATTRITREIDEQNQQASTETKNTQLDRECGSNK